MTNQQRGEEMVKILKRLMEAGRLPREVVADLMETSYYQLGRWLNGAKPQHKRSLVKLEVTIHHLALLLKKGVLPVEAKGPVWEQVRTVREAVGLCVSPLAPDFDAALIPEEAAREPLFRDPETESLLEQVKSKLK